MKLKLKFPGQHQESKIRSILKEKAFIPEASELNFQPNTLAST